LLINFQTVVTVPHFDPANFTTHDSLLFVQAPNIPSHLLASTIPQTLQG
jgi:hypothetical protein